MTIYLDSNIFIYAVLGEASDTKPARAIGILKDIAEGKVQGVTSPMVIDEVVWIIQQRTKDRDIAIKTGINILQLPLRFVPVNQQLTLSALKMMQTYPKLSPRDALHAAACISAGASILSDDSDFDIIKEMKRMPL